MNDAPIGPEDLVGLTFDHEPTMDDLEQLKRRIKAGFGSDVKVQITLHYRRVHIDIAFPVHAGKRATQTSIPVAGSETTPP